MRFLLAYILQKKLATEFRLHASCLTNEIETKSRKGSLGGPHFHSEEELSCPTTARGHLLMLLMGTCSGDNSIASSSSHLIKVCCNLNTLFLSFPQQLWRTIFSFLVCRDLFTYLRPVFTSFLNLLSSRLDQSQNWHWAQGESSSSILWSQRLFYLPLLLLFSQSTLCCLLCKWKVSKLVVNNKKLSSLKCCDCCLI